MGFHKYIGLLVFSLVSLLDCKICLADWHQLGIRLTSQMSSLSRPPLSIPMTQNVIPMFLPNIKSQHLERVFTFVSGAGGQLLGVRWGCWHSVTSVRPEPWHMCSHHHQWMTIRPKHHSYKNWKQYSAAHLAGVIDSHLSHSWLKYNALTLSFLSQ